MNTFITDSFIDYFYKHSIPNFRLTVIPTKILSLKDLRYLYIYSRILNQSDKYKSFKLRFHNLSDDFNLFNCEYNFLNVFQWINYNLTDIVLDFSSDHLEQSFDYACQLIKNDFAYVDDSDFGKDRTVEENLGLFLRMSHNEFAPGEKVLRLRLSVLNDPIIYSIRTIQPTLDKTYFICPSDNFINIIADSIEQITHVLTDDNDLIILTNWLRSKLNIHKPQPIAIPKANFKDYSLYELNQQVSIQEINTFIDETFNTPNKYLDILQGK